MALSGSSKARGAGKSKKDAETSKSSSGEAPKVASSSVENSTESNRLTAIGHAIWLMSRSPVHKHLMITDTEWLVTPPIMLNQFRLWQQKGTPIGFASWAYFGPEAEGRIVEQGIRRIMPTDWKSGETLWLIDFVAPMGGQEAMLKELREQIFAGKKMKMLQPTPDGKVGVVEW